jgi:membrane protein implicated in regulation of membrane protease activity
MENFYPIFAVVAALAALVIGGAELILLNIKPAAFLTWLGGWAVAMSLTFSSHLSLIISTVLAFVISVLYVMGAFKIWGNFNKKT